MAKKRWEHDWRVAPGEILKEWMVENDVSRTQLAGRSNLQLSHVRDILDGSARVTPMVAGCLEVATGIRGQVWINLETEYRRPL